MLQGVVNTERSQNPGYIDIPAYVYWGSAEGQEVLASLAQEHSTVYTQLMLGLIRKQDDEGISESADLLCVNLSNHLVGRYRSDEYISSRDSFWITQRGERLLESLVQTGPELYVNVIQAQTALIWRRLREEEEKEEEHRDEQIIRTYGERAEALESHLLRTVSSSPEYWSESQGLSILSNLRRCDRTLYLSVMGRVFSRRDEYERSVREAFGAHFASEVVADSKFWLSDRGFIILGKLIVEDEVLYELIMKVLIDHFEKNDPVKAYELQVQRDIDRFQAGSNIEEIVLMEPLPEPGERLRQLILDYVALTLDPPGSCPWYTFRGATGIPVLDLALWGRLALLKGADLSVDVAYLRRLGVHLSPEEIGRLQLQTPEEVRSRIGELVGGLVNIRDVFMAILGEIGMSRDQKMIHEHIALAIQQFESLFPDVRQQQAIDRVRSIGYQLWREFEDIFGPQVNLVSRSGGIEVMNRVVTAAVVAILQFSVDQIARQDAERILQTGRMISRPETEDERFRVYYEILEELKEKGFVPKGLHEVEYAHGYLKFFHPRYWTSRGLGVTVTITLRGLRVLNPHKTLGEAEKVPEGDKKKRVRKYGGGPDDIVIPWHDITQSMPEVDYTGVTDFFIRINTFLKQALGFNRDEAVEKWKAVGPGSLRLMTPGREAPLIEFPPIWNPGAIGVILKRVAAEVMKLGPKDAADLLRYLFNPERMEIPVHEERMVPKARGS